MQNARLTERASFLGQVDVVPHASARALRVWGQDVSETGMFLQTTQPFRVGETVSLRFDVEQLEVHVRAAEVVWVRPFEPIAVDGCMPGVGLRFVSVDPPARAALRRLARAPHEAVNDTIVEKIADQAEAGGLPAPKLTLPPLTTSIVERARGQVPRRPDPQRPIADTQEMISLPPFSELPVISLAPDDGQLSSEARVFDGVPRGPRSVTMGPTTASSKRKKSTQPMFASLPDSQPARPAHDDAGDDVDLFVGWSFRPSAALPVAASDAGPDTAPSFCGDAPDAAARGLEMAMPPGLSMRFDDDAPRNVAPRSFVGEPSILESVDAAEMTHTDDGAPYSLGSLPPGFAEGTLAVRHLPLVEERATAPSAQPRKPKRSLGTAVAFLAAGCCAGAVVGVVNHRAHRPTTTTTTTTAMTTAMTTATATTASAPASMAPIAPAATLAVLAATMAPLSVADAEAALIPPAPRVTEPAPLAEPALAALSEPEKKKKPEAKPQALASATKLPKREPLVAAPGRVEVVLPEGGTVKRVFALSSPSRVVVDLVGARLPQKPLDVDEGGVLQLRFGHPDAGTERVVIVVAGGDKPQAPKASVDGDRLTVRWSW